MSRGRGGRGEGRGWEGRGGEGRGGEGRGGEGRGGEGRGGREGALTSHSLGADSLISVPILLSHIAHSISTCLNLASFHSI